jgi:hypothetical protein
MNISLFLDFSADALSRSEAYRSEIEVDLSKERSESAALRDLLCKIQALNEGLAQDKIELNKIILLVEQEKNSISNEKYDADQDKSTLRQVIRISMMKIFLFLSSRNWSKSNKRKSMWKMNEIVRRRITFDSNYLLFSFSNSSSFTTNGSNSSTDRTGIEYCE